MSEVVVILLGFAALIAAIVLLVVGAAKRAIPLSDMAATRYRVGPSRHFDKRR